MPLILLAWLIAVALRQATGSATVATTTTAGIVAPVVAGLSTTHNSLMAHASGGALNFRVAIVLQTIVSVVGLTLTLVLWTVLT